MGFLANAEKNILIRPLFFHSLIFFASPARSIVPSCGQTSLFKKSKEKPGENGSKEKRRDEERGRGERDRMRLGVYRSRVEDEDVGGRRVYGYIDIRRCVSRVETLKNITSHFLGDRRVSHEYA